MKPNRPSSSYSSLSTTGNRNARPPTRMDESNPIPNDPMEFLSRSWNLPSVDGVSHCYGSTKNRGKPSSGEADEISGTVEFDDAAVFSFASSTTSQLVMERIMSQSDVSPLTSGRLSHSSGPLTGPGSLSDSPPLSPAGIDEVKYCRGGALAMAPPQYRGSGKTVGRWLKDRREKKKEETRAHNAQLHAALSVAGVAAAVAAVAAATAAVSAPWKDEQATKIDMAVASAATLVAAQLVESAESMGVEREQLASVVHSAVNVRTPGDIVTLTAAAATALRGAATLKARALKDVWNIAAVIPVEKSALGGAGTTTTITANNSSRNVNIKYDDCRLNPRRSIEPRRFSDEFIPEENFLGLCNQELLARGTELLKRTRKGDLHWKVVSVYINKMGQVTVKMKSRHVAGTFTKKKKNIVADVCMDVQAWPGRHLLEGCQQRRYFGLKTVDRRVIEFECRSQREYEIWTQGVARLLGIVADKICGGGRRD